jgi:hypothetical protein
VSNRGIIITAIVAPILVGVLLLQVEQSFFSVSGKVNRELRKEAEKVLVPLDAKEKIAPEFYIEEDVSELKVLYQVASKIYGTNERNLEYFKIIDLCLKEEKPGFAFIKVVCMVYVVA